MYDHKVGARNSFEIDPEEFQIYIKGKKTSMPMFERQFIDVCRASECVLQNSCYVCGCWIILVEISGGPTEKFRKRR